MVEEGCPCWVRYGCDFIAVSGVAANVIACAAVTAGDGGVVAPDEGPADGVVGVDIVAFARLRSETWISHHLNDKFHPELLIEYLKAGEEAKWQY